MWPATRQTALVGTLILAALGCGDSGPQLYHVSGTIHFNGKPVPAGKVYFNPDVTRGNRGPQGYADIKDGKFDTSQGGRANTGGAVVVRIEGFESTGQAGVFGRPLFAACEMKDDLPKEACTRTFEVPASAADGLPGDVGPLP